MIQPANGACQSSTPWTLPSLQACKPDVHMQAACTHLLHQSSQHGQWEPQTSRVYPGVCSSFACGRFDDGQHKPDVDEDIEGADDKAVTKEVLDELERFLYFANVIYEAGNDKTLTRLLGDKGRALPLKIMPPSAIAGLLHECQQSLGLQTLPSQAIT